MNYQKCDALGIICYQKASLNGTKNMTLKDGCYESCKNVKYSLTLLENSHIDVTASLHSYGQDTIDYFFKSNKISDYMGNFWNSGDFLRKRLQRFSLVHINFEESKVWTVTKDAKVTTTDMIGNVGGTLGVFIGFSFLGLLETLIKWMQILQNKIRCLKK